MKVESPESILSAFKQFEDIGAWQKARQLTGELYRISRQGEFARDFGLRDQICRAGVSVMSNIAEGHERGGKAEFIRFLVIAKGSAGEVRSQLYIAMDQGYLDSATFGRLLELTQEVGRMISGLINYLKSSDYQNQARA